MKTVELRNPAASEQAIRDGQTEEVVVFRDGRPVAMVVPFDEDDLQWYAKERDPAFVESIARARRQLQSGQAVPHDDLKRQLGIEQVAAASPDPKERDLVDRLRARTHQRLETTVKGVRFLVDDAGRRTDVILDLRQHRKIWEEMYDRLLIASRRDQPRESLEDVRRRLARRNRKSGMNLD